jgi:Calcium binding
MARAKDNAREERIVMEAIVDAYGSEERAMGWYYYYLDNKLKFPFMARCRSVRPISMLKAGEQVEVVGMAPEDECESEMFVWIVRDAGRIALPLAQLRLLSKDRDTQEAVGDWLYWVDRGYEM